MIVVAQQLPAIRLCYYHDYYMSQVFTLKNSQRKCDSVSINHPSTQLGYLNCQTVERADTANWSQCSAVVSFTNSTNGTMAEVHSMKMFQYLEIS